MILSYKYKLWVSYPILYIYGNVVCIIFILFSVIYNLEAMVNILKIISYYITKMMGGSQGSSGNSGGPSGGGSSRNGSSGGNPGGNPGENPWGGPIKKSEKKSWEEQLDSDMLDRRRQELQEEIRRREKL